MGSGRIVLWVLMAAMLFFVVSGSIVEYENDKPRDAPVGTRDLNSLVDQVKINSYFIGNNSYWEMCRVHGDRIRDKEPGYELAKYDKFRIVNIRDGWDYTHDIYVVENGGYEMAVDISCRYNIRVQLNAFGYHEERLVFDGGRVLFNMDIREDEGYYRLIGMDAYEHVK